MQRKMKKLRLNDGLPKKINKTQPHIIIFTYY